MNRFPFERANPGPSVTVRTVYADEPTASQPQRTSHEPQPQPQLQPRSEVANGQVSPVVPRSEEHADGVPDLVQPDGVREAVEAIRPARPVQPERAERQAQAELTPLQAEYSHFEPGDVDVDKLLGSLRSQRKSPTFLAFDRDDTMLSEDMG